MNRKSRRVNRRTARRFKSHPKLYKHDTAGVVILITPSATGKGIHKRWKYSEPCLNTRQTIPAERDSTGYPSPRELTLHVDGAFADIFNRSLSSIGANLKAKNHTTDRLVNGAFGYLFHHLPSCSSSTPQLENITRIASDEDMARTPEQTSSPLRYIVPGPRETEEEEVAIRGLKKEQQMEDTFMVQWQKMLEQRKAAMRSIRRWVRKGRPKYDASSSTDDEDTKAEDMETANNADTSTIEPGMSEGQKGESRKANLRRCPLGPCGTIIVEDPYDRGERNSPPPVYPTEWVARKLAGRESTESIESRN